MGESIIVEGDLNNSVGKNGYEKVHGGLGFEL